MSNSNPKLTVFLDAIGRTILGSIADETDITLSVENPSLIHVQPNPATNQLQLQIIPLFFKEFLADRNESTIWNYNKATITIANDIAFADQFVSQYKQMWAPPPPPSGETKVVKLFDDDDEEKS